MENLRMLGSSIQKGAEARRLSAKEVGDAIRCGERQVLSLYKGRSICSFAQLKTIAELYSVPVGELLAGDENYYERTVIHCMNRFHSADNREEILDIIYDYLDICDLVSSNCIQA